MGGGLAHAATIVAEAVSSLGAAWAEAQPGRADARTVLIARPRPALVETPGAPAAAESAQVATRRHGYDRRMPQREPEPHAERALSLAHPLARGVVDRRRVVGAEGIADARHVGRDPEPDAEDARGGELEALAT